MRSRYTAYTRLDGPYLQETWHPSSVPSRVSTDPELVWTGLEIIGTEGGGRLDLNGVVNFVANYRRGGVAGQLRERSRFTRVDGRWLYLDGEALDEIA